MKTINKIVHSLLIVLMPFILVGQDLITAKKAADLSAKGEITLISARTPADYAKVHAPGAININHTDLYGELAMLKPTGELAAILSEKGISSSDHLVIYDDGSMKSAGRMYWILKYLGTKQVSVVDGGMKAWRISRLPVTKNPTIANKGTFVANVDKSIYADFQLVKSAIGQSSYVILDVRSLDEYAGPGTATVKAGHIPSAMNLEFSDLLEANGEMKNKIELERLFASVGVSKSKKVILYCESSVRAGVVFLSLKSILEYPDVRVYDGAFLEWQSKAGSSIETQ